MKLNLREFDETGRYWFRDAVPNSELQKLEQFCDVTGKAGARITGSQGLDEIFNPFSSLMQLASKIMPKSRPVRIIAFNKTDIMNWSLPWHQDRVIAVKNKISIDGYKNWSRKNGVWHCEPPLEVLEQIVFARVHLNEATALNGALNIALESHKAGDVPMANIDNAVSECEVEICDANRGDVLFAKGLIMHRSGISSSPAPRRAIRVDFTAQNLPDGLEWDLFSSY